MDFLRNSIISASWACGETWLQWLGFAVKRLRNVEAYKAEWCVLNSNRPVKQQCDFSAGLIGFDQYGIVLVVSYDPEAWSTTTWLEGKRDSVST